MAFVAALAPYLAAAAPYAAAGAAAYQGATAAQASKYQSDVEAQEQKVAVDQSNAQEGLVRRNSREMLGRQAAAFGAAGVGYGGSSEIALDQSAVNQELDALNTRYKGAITGYGYGVQSQIDRSEAGDRTVSAGLLAGAALLNRKNPTYSFSPQTPAQQSGAVPPG